MPLANAWCIEDPFHTEYFGIPVFGVVHPGANGTRASGGAQVTTPRWHALGEFFRSTSKLLLQLSIAAIRTSAPSNQFRSPDTPHRPFASDTVPSPACINTG